MIACVSNSIMLFAFVICLLYTIGDIDLVSSTPTGLPLIEVFFQATKSKGATVVLVLMPAFMILLALFNAFASCSRLVWQFARDEGLPFSKTFAYVSIELQG
jgi:choline transport protein